MHLKYLFVTRFKSNQLIALVILQSHLDLRTWIVASRRVAMTFSDAVKNEEASDAQLGVAYQRRALSHTGRANVSLSERWYLPIRRRALSLPTRAGRISREPPARSIRLSSSVSLSLFLFLSPILTRLT